ncbi:MAG: ABC transporter permease [Acutalibacteraceae bacterium]|nr:ABC transporter permease [Acutalibacteraceae bacterium]
MTNKKNIWLSGPYIIWIAGFIILPILTIVYYAFTDATKKFTFSNIVNAVTDTANLKALGLTVLLATLATLICLLLAYPLAICLTKSRIKNKTLLIYLFILPIFMNFMLQMVAINVILEDNGIINSLLAAVGLPKFHIANTFTAILIGMSYDYFPFMLLPIYNTISRIDKDYINASKDLGANSLKTFLKVTFPLTLPGVVSGITMVFVPAISDFAIAEMLGGGKIMLIGNVVEMSFTKGHYYQGSGLALLLMVFVLLSSLIPTGDSDTEGGAIIL